MLSEKNLPRSPSKLPPKAPTGIVGFDQLGVEAIEQSDLLRTLGCDEFQGYLFSEPVPVDVFEGRFVNSSLIN